MRPAGEHRPESAPDQTPSGPVVHSLSELPGRQSGSSEPTYLHCRPEDWIIPPLLRSSMLRPIPCDEASQEYDAIAPGTSWESLNLRMSNPYLMLVQLLVARMSWDQRRNLYQTKVLTPLLPRFSTEAMRADCGATSINRATHDPRGRRSPAGLSARRGAGVRSAAPGPPSRQSGRVSATVRLRWRPTGIKPRDGP
jgi:hypothetical protein